MSAPVCLWCGKTLAEHRDEPLPSGAVPRMPCVGLKSGFFPRAEEPPVQRGAFHTDELQRTPFCCPACLASAGGEGHACRWDGVGKPAGTCAPTYTCTCGWQGRLDELVPEDQAVRN